MLRNKSYLPVFYNKKCSCYNLFPISNNHSSVSITFLNSMSEISKLKIDDGNVFFYSLKTKTAKGNFFLFFKLLLFTTKLTVCFDKNR